MLDIGTVDLLDGIEARHIARETRAPVCLTNTFNSTRRP
jgi:hypothetical protein